jgi:hypothetical protein
MQGDSEKLQGISRKIQDGLELGFKLSISSAANHSSLLRHPIPPCSQPTRIRATAKSS